MAKKAALAARPIKIVKLRHDQKARVAFFDVLTMTLPRMHQKGGIWALDMKKLSRVEP